MLDAVPRSAGQISEMRSELVKLAVAGTAVTFFIWVLSALAPRLPEHVGYLIRFADC